MYFVVELQYVFNKFLELKMHKIGPVMRRKYLYEKYWNLETKFCVTCKIQIRMASFKKRFFKKVLLF